MGSGVEVGGAANVGVATGNVGKKVGIRLGRAVGTMRVGGGKVGRATAVGIMGAAGGGGWGSSEYHQGSLPGAGHNEASKPKTSSANTTAPS